MDITSEKRYKTITVTDLEITYLGGGFDTISFCAQDVVSDTPESIAVYIHDEAGATVIETITCLKRNMLNYRYRERQIRVEDKTPLVIPAALSEVGDPTGD